MTRRVHILGAPLDLGAGRRGVDMGPSALRLTHLGARLRELGLEVVDQGNVDVAVAEATGPGDPRCRYLDEVAATCRQVFEHVQRTVRDGAIPLTLGGDHSIAVGSVGAVSATHAARGERIGLLWIDAHADINTPETTPSGNVHGMPLAISLGMGADSFVKMRGFYPKVHPDKVALIGVRDLDPGERRNIAESGLHVFTMNEVDRRGFSSVMEEALAIATNGTQAVHVSFDMDVVDPVLAPGVGTPVRGGLSYREAHLAMELIAESKRLTSLEVVEANPILDVKNSTADLGVELILSALGKRIM